MKKHRCPYCSRRITYFSAYSSRRKAEYICRKCGKESRVAIDKKIFFAFFAAVAVSVLIMLLWILFGLCDNILGVFLVASPLAVFFATSPNFLRFEPLKKYQKSMEAKKAGIEYSDNLISSELDDITASGVSFDSGSDFKIDSDLFNSIKTERNSAKKNIDTQEEIMSNSDEIGKTKMFNAKKEDMIPIIDKVRENHSESDAPLKKIHSDQQNMARTRHHYVSSDSDYSGENENKAAQEEKPDGNKYSANRRF